MQLPVDFGNGDRVDELIRLEGFNTQALSPPLTYPIRVHTCVDHKVGNVDVLWVELAGHALRHRPKTELCAGKGRIARAAPDTRRGAGKENGPLASPQHQASRFTTSQEASVAGHF